MTIKRYNSEKDNTIVNALKENLSSRGSKGNLGSSDILEIFSIFGQSSTGSLEKARIIVQFPVSSISQDRDSGIIPISGSASFKLKMSNVPHGQTTPKNYSLVAHPLVRPWTEGDGLDMENYLDIEASNWLSASDGVAWHSTGSDFASSSYINTSIVPYKYSQELNSGVENIEMDITGLTEEWIKNHKGTKTAATASINFLKNPSGASQSISIFSHEGEEYIYTFVTSSFFQIGNSMNVQLSGTTAGTAGALKQRIDIDFGGKISTNLSGSFLTLTQSVPGIHGNTIISSSIPSATSSISGFGGGVSMPNYGLVIKLRDDYEDGSRQRSYYTKKFYSRTSHEFFLKPQIEAQWDSTIKDDRSYVIKSSSVAPADDNLNNIYYYNNIRGNIVDIPSTGSRKMVVQLYPSLGAAPVSIVQAGGLTSNFITSSRETTGIYKASFAYAGNETYLYDVWKKDEFTAAVSGVAASASVSFTGVPSNGETFTITDTLLATASFIVDSSVTTSDASQDGSNRFIVGSSGAATSDFVDRLHSVFVSQSAVQITAADPSGGTILALTQDTTGSDGNTTLDLSGVTNASLAAGTGFQGGVTFIPAFHTYTDFVTGSGFSVSPESVDSSYPISNYIANITNLKSSYLQGEKATFRVYTRNKNWSPNIYTIASQTAPVNTIKQMYYKITKVSDNYEVISYSTGSTPSYSELSYDKDGSYFDLDMSLLEKNNAYQINFVFKDGPNYIELSEKFRFRVDP